MRWRGIRRDSCLLIKKLVKSNMYIELIVVVVILIGVIIVNNSKRKMENFTPFIASFPVSVPQKFNKAFHYPKKLDWNYYKYSDEYYAPMYRWSPYHHQNFDGDKTDLDYDDGMGKPLAQKLHYGYSHF